MSFTFLTISPDNKKQMLPAYERLHEYKPLMWVEEYGKQGDHPHWHLLLTLPSGLKNKNRLYDKLNLNPQHVMIKQVLVTKRKVKYYYIGYMQKEEKVRYYVIPDVSILEKGRQIYEIKKGEMHLPKNVKGSALAAWIVQNNLSVDEFMIKYPTFDIYDPSVLKDLVRQRVKLQKKSKQLTLIEAFEKHEILDEYAEYVRTHWNLGDHMLSQSEYIHKWRSSKEYLFQ